MTALSAVFENEELVQQDWRSKVRLYSNSYVNHISVELRAVWQIKQLKKPKTIKQEIMVGKRNVKKVGGGGGRNK